MDGEKGKKEGEIKIKELEEEIEKQRVTMERHRQEDMEKVKQLENDLHDKDKMFKE